MNAYAAGTSDLTPLEFLKAVMTDPKVAPSLRVKAALGAAPFMHPKPTAAPADAARDAKLVEAQAEQLAKIDSANQRIIALELVEIEGELTPAGAAELSASAWRR